MFNSITTYSSQIQSITGILSLFMSIVGLWYAHISLDRWKKQKKEEQKFQTALNFSKAVSKYEDAFRDLRARSFALRDSNPLVATQEFYGHRLTGLSLARQELDAALIEAEIILKDCNVDELIRSIYGLESELIATVQTMLSRMHRGVELVKENERGWREEQVMNWQGWRDDVFWNELHEKIALIKSRIDPYLKLIH